MHCRSNGEGIRKVVDVFARAGEVGEFSHRVQSQRRQSAAHVIFHRLDIMAGGCFQRGEFVDVGLTKIGDQGSQSVNLACIQPTGTTKFVIGEIKQPLNLNVHPCTVESRFGQVFTKPGYGGSIATVEWTEGLFWQWSHGATVVFLVLFGEKALRSTSRSCRAHART